MWTTPYLSTSVDLQQLLLVVGGFVAGGRELCIIAMLWLTTVLNVALEFIMLMLTCSRRRIRRSRDRTQPTFSINGC